MHRIDFKSERALLRRSVLVLPLGAAAAYLVWRELAEHGGPPRPAWLDCVADLVIPATDTPSASQVQVPAFVALAVEHGLNDCSPQMLQDLHAMLDRAAMGAFESAAPSTQAAVLQAIDEQAFSGNAGPHHPWQPIKGLIVMGYYTSQPGASQELRWAFVPGRFDADIPVSPGTRALGNDWVGNLLT